MIIRLALPDDLAAIQGCARAAYARYVARIGREPAPMVADFAALIATGKLHVAREQERVVGFVVCYPRGDHLHLENVAVVPVLQGRGIGSRLVAFVEGEARRRGLAAVELYTNAKMIENLAIYPRLGYAETARRSEDGFDRVFFRKELA
jgi:ribosomal protein S18 acetylase RimI-like enzyme